MMILIVMLICLLMFWMGRYSGGRDARGAAKDLQSIEDGIIVEVMGIFNSSHNMMYFLISHKDEVTLYEIDKAKIFNERGYSLDSLENYKGRCCKFRMSDNYSVLVKRMV